MSLGKMFLSAVLAEGSVSGLLQHGPMDHLFKASEIDAYKFVREFVKSYQKLPTADTIEAHTGETLVPHTEPAGYYFDLLELRHTELALKQGMKKASDLLLPENKDPAEALRVITDTAMQLIAHKNAKQVVDFRDAYEMLMADYVAKWNAPDQYGLQLGWPTLDEMTGGLVKGDLISFIGRPAAGKTWMMLYAALHGWRKEALLQPDHYEQSRMFVSMEMNALSIQQRLIAIQASLPFSKIKHASLSTVGLKQLKEGLLEIKGYGAPFYVVDGNLTATVEDIWMLARQLKPDGLFIDGGYLVKHPFVKDRYQRVAENCNLMKQELTPLAPTCVSWQFAKTASKKNPKKGEKVTVDDIGYTDAIAQDSSLAIGLSQEDSVETLNQRVADILKGRNGEVGSFLLRWLFDKMDFSEIEDQDVAELQFV